MSRQRLDVMAIRVDTFEPVGEDPAAEPNAQPSPSADLASCSACTLEGVPCCTGRYCFF